MFGAKRADRRQELTPMADQRDPKFLEVFGRQIEQHFGVDRVLPERVFVLLKPEAAQPNVGDQVLGGGGSGERRWPNGGACEAECRS